jgi:hypothetical protein
MGQDRADGIFYIPSRREGVAIACLAVATSWAGEALAIDVLSGVASAFILSTLFGIRLLWPLRCQPSWWLSVAGISVVHAWLILNWPWETEDWRGRTYAFVALVDLLVVICIMVLTRKLAVAAKLEDEDLVEPTNG